MCRREKVKVCHKWEANRFCTKVACAGSVCEAIGAKVDFFSLAFWARPGLEDAQ